MRAAFLPPPFNSSGRFVNWLSALVYLLLFWGCPVHAENGGGRAVASVKPIPAGVQNLEMGRRFYEMGRLRQASNYLLEAAKSFENQDPTLSKFETYYLQGNIYALEGQHSQALQYHYKAEQVANVLKLVKPQGDASLAIGKDLLALKDPAQASIQLEKAIRAYADVHALPQAASAELYYGEACLAQRKYTLAEVAFRQSIDLSKEAGDDRGTVLATERLARALQQQHQYADAINQLQVALTLADGAQLSEEKATIFLDLTECYNKAASKDKALFYGKVGLRLALRFKSLVQQERAHLLLHTIYKEQNKPAAALEHYKAYANLRDRIANDIRNRQLTEMRLRYQNEKIAKEIAVLTRERRIQELDLNGKQNLIWSGLGVIALLGFIALILQRKNQAERSTNTKLQQINQKIEQQRDQIEVQKVGLKEALGELESSILYAKRIQDAILAASAPLAPAFADPVLYFRPKAIVSGDFYWVSHQGDESVLVVADCTGHGVPGAFLSLVGHSTLVRALAVAQNLDPAQILSFIDTEISRILGNRPGLDLKEGIEMSVCVVNRAQHTLRFSGARRDALLVSTEAVITLKSSRRSVGGVYASKAPLSWNFETQQADLPSGCSLYLMSDGLTDQHGDDGKMKYGLPRLRSLLQSMVHEPAYTQTSILDNELTSWRGATEQTDDILLVGVKLG